MSRDVCDGRCRLCGAEGFGNRICTDLWTGEFGNRYTERNTRATLQARKDMWACMLPSGCDSILEVGANVGLNLEAISSLTGAELYACEPNDMARAELAEFLSRITSAQTCRQARMARSTV
jgi:hypothetical protein